MMRGIPAPRPMLSAFERSTSRADAPAVGLTRNWRQFWLLVVVNAFVGGMVGLERAVLPLFARQDFGLASTSAMLTFLASFGVVKAFTNIVAGRGSERLGRKPLLVLGWIAALPVPYLLMWAPTWNWVIAANVLLGINQGLCWSTTVVMKIDLAGPHRRGLAMGLNECAGYGAVALAASACALVAASVGIRAALFALGVAFSMIGLLLSAVLVRETVGFAHIEARTRREHAQPPSFSRVFLETSLTDRNLAACCQAGFVNNLNDGVAWGLFPLLFAAGGLGVGQVGALVAVYPAVWGLAQVGAGALSDRWGRKWPIVAGMWMQAIGFWIIAAGALFPQRFAVWVGGSVLLGVGTALVYPTLLAAVGDRAHPTWRASAVGVYRCWRDLGYAGGAVVSGLVADRFGIGAAIVVVGVLTFASGAICAVRMTGPPSLAAAA